MSLNQGGEALNLITADRNYKQSRRLLDFALTFSALDPFVCNGSDRPKKSKYAELMRKRWTKFAFCATIFMSIKHMMVFLLRTIQDKLRGDENGQQTGDLDWLLKLTGDAFASPPFLNIIFYLFLPILGLCIRCYLPIYLKQVHPYDCSLARFILAPIEEIKHFDHQAYQIIKTTMEALERNRRKQSYSLRFESEYRHSSLYQQTIQRQLVQMGQLAERIQLIRPNILGSVWHKRMYKMTTMLAFSVTTLNALIISVGVIHFTGVGWRSRCNQLAFLSGQLYDRYATFWPNCHLLEAFNLPDLLMICETLLLTLVSISAPVSVMVVFHVMQMQHQLRLTEEVGRHLSRLLADLCRVHQRELVGSSGICPIEQLTGRLFANWVRLQMFERESRKSVTMLAHTTRIGVFSYFLFTAVAFVSLRLQTALNQRISLGLVGTITTASYGVDLQLSIILICVAWIFAVLQQTLVLYSCAIIPAQIGRLDRTVYSLMAELIRIQFNYRQAHNLEPMVVSRWSMRIHEYGQCTDYPIVSLWRRLALSRAIEGDLPAVRVLSTSVTHERVLSIQFYLAAIILMLCTYV